MENSGALKVGKTYQILGYRQCCPVRIMRRLCDLGLIPEKKLKVEKKSLFGKAILIETQGYTLSMQRSMTNYLLLRESK